MIPKLLNAFTLAQSPLDLALGALLMRAAVATLVTAAFTLAAYRVRGVNRSGALAGAVTAFVLYVSAGPGAFVALVSVFLLAIVATRFGYSKKSAMGTAERSSGRRASQVIANLGIATLAAVLFALTRASLALVAMAAALAEAAADTVSSECGQAVRTEARLITTWHPVPAGTDGGISLPGTVAGIVAGLLVGVACAFAGQIAYRALPIIWVSATLGMFFDSVLGGTLENRRRLNNDQVNFLSTAAAAIFALLFNRIWP